MTTPQAVVEEFNTADLITPSRIVFEEQSPDLVISEVPESADGLIVRQPHSLANLGGGQLRNVRQPQNLPFVGCELAENVGQ